MAEASRLSGKLREHLKAADQTDETQLYQNVRIDMADAKKSKAGVKGTIRKAKYEICVSRGQKKKR